MHLIRRDTPHRTRTGASLPTSAEKPTKRNIENQRANDSITNEPSLVYRHHGNGGSQQLFFEIIAVIVKYFDDMQLVL